MNELTAKDLMIGDFVYFNCLDGSKIVVCMTGFTDGIVYGDSEKGSHWCNIKKVEPIPLTNKILEKNEFVKSYWVSDTPPYDKDEEGNMYYSFKGEHKFWGWWQPDNTYYIPANAMGDIVIKYVHQLQHALRLAGIEKNIIV